MSTVKTQHIKHIKEGYDQSAELQEEIDRLESVVKGRDAALQKRNKEMMSVHNMMEERRKAIVDLWSLERGKPLSFTRFDDS